MVLRMRWFVLASCLLASTVAGAAPFTWQAPDGTAVTAEVSQPLGESARLETSAPTRQTLPLVPSPDQQTWRVQGDDDDLVVVGRDRAWRLRWKQDRLAIIATTAWTANESPPRWARPRPRSREGALEELRQLLRFEGTQPGLDSFFAAKRIRVVTSAAGEKDSSSVSSGAVLLDAWHKSGFPMAYGRQMSLNRQCGSLLENAASEKPRRASPRSLLFSVCFDKNLHVTTIHLVRPEASEAPSANAVLDLGDKPAKPRDVVVGGIVDPAAATTVSPSAGTQDLEVAVTAVRCDPDDEGERDDEDHLREFERQARSLLQRHNSEFLSCHAQRSQDPPVLHLRFGIDAKGDLIAPLVIGGHPKVSTCVVAAITGEKLAPRDGGDTMRCTARLLFSPPAQ
jgi:hypothetical protein